MTVLSLRLISPEFAICRLAPVEPVPAWADSPVFSSITRTKDELSIVCPVGQVPTGIKTERNWRLLQCAGPWEFDAVGVMAAITAPLAGAGISLLAIATFDTDHVLVKSDRLDAAVRALREAGHRVILD